MTTGQGGGNTAASNVPAVGTTTSALGMADRDNPATRSTDRAQMDKWLNLIDDIRAGAEAIRQAGEKYLPKYEGEDRAEYERRLKSAPWRPEFEDALRHLSSKPFEEDVQVTGDKVPESIKVFAEDVDGRGNNITQFAADYFDTSVADGVSVLFVDYPAAPDGLTKAQEMALGLRPVWILIEAKRIISLVTGYEEGREVVTHLRYHECVKKRDGYAETVVERIREYNTGSWKVWELDKNKRWNLALDDDGTPMEGSFARGSKKFESIPAVPFYTGKRVGDLKTKPSLLELADMQIELYRALSREDEVLTFAASPLLTANGMSAPKAQAGKPLEPLVVGPKSVLYAPASRDGGTASWNYINPNSGNIQEIRKKTNDIIQDMKRLGMQPLVAGSGNPTATGQSLEASKAHSAVKAWALRLKDCLEQAMVFTCEWLNEPTEVEVSVFTDFDVMPFAQAPLTALKGARDSGDLSQRTYWEGLRRFDTLPHDFDPEKEEERIAEESANAEPELGDGDEIPAPDPEGEIDPAQVEDTDDISDEQLRAMFGDTMFDEVMGA